LTDLVLGPLLRYVDETRATVWVQTGAPGLAEVRCEGGRSGSSRTFTVHGNHYALVAVDGLAAGGSYPYTVWVDGERAWPDPDDRYPPPRIRTIDPERGLRLLFGSCRTSVPHDAADIVSHGVDVLRAYAQGMAEAPESEWPSLLLMLGDQVYADEPPPAAVEFIAAHRDPDDEPVGEIADFAEYAELYRLAWTETAIRWLLSTVPTAMIFDDHDLRDDWNTSAAWQERMRKLRWWRRRVVAGIGSYWVYQHLGNLPPDELIGDALYAKVTASDGDAGELLDAFAWQADTTPASYRWSFARDYGPNRLVVLDSRCARVLTPGARAMLDPTEWDWFDGRATGGVAHLVIGSSLPVMLPTGLHLLESWNEAVCDGAWGRRAAVAAERLRQGMDLEHWGAFRTSFDRLAKVVSEVARGERGAPPASVLFLSGDVHYSYVAEVRTRRLAAAIYQVVCSPIRNPLARTLRLLNGLASFGVAAVLGRALARAAGVRRPPVSWRIRRGPYFQNAVGTLDLVGRSAQLRLQTARIGKDGLEAITTIAEQPLTTD
jgi:hypothetical protein